MFCIRSFTVFMLYLFIIQYLFSLYFFTFLRSPSRYFSKILPTFQETLFQGFPQYICFRRISETYKTSLYLFLLKHSFPLMLALSTKMSTPSLLQKFWLLLWFVIWYVVLCQIQQNAIYWSTNMEFIKDDFWSALNFCQRVLQSITYIMNLWQLSHMGLPMSIILNNKDQ